MADHFGIKKSDIIEDQPAAPATTANAMELSEREIILIKKYRQLDADGKADINDLIDSKLARAERAAKEQEEALG